MTTLEQEANKILIEGKAIISDPDKWGKTVTLTMPNKKKLIQHTLKHVNGVHSVS